MKILKLIKVALCLVLSFALVEVNYALNAFASGMIPTNAAVSDLARTQHLEKIQSFIDRADVQSEFVKRGVSPEEAKMRVAGLSDFELQQVAGNIDNAPAGADVIVISLGTVLLVIVILLLLDRL